MELAKSKKKRGEGAERLSLVQLWSSQSGPVKPSSHSKGCKDFFGG